MRRLREAPGKEGEGEGDGEVKPLSPSVTVLLSYRAPSSLSPVQVSAVVQRAVIPAPCFGSQIFWGVCPAILLPGGLVFSGAGPRSVGATLAKSPLISKMNRALDFIKSQAFDT